MAPCTAAGLICCYVGLDVTTCPPSTILCDGELRLICIDLMCCLAQGKEQMPVGMVKEDGKICKVSLPIISASAFNPDMSNLIKLDGNLLCIKAAGQLPFGGPTPGPICSLYGAQCALADGKPVFGCCTSPYTGGAFKCEDSKGAPDTETIER